MSDNVNSCKSEEAQSVNFKDYSLVERIILIGWNVIHIALVLPL